MKTTKTIAALSIAMILFGFTALAGKPGNGNPDVLKGTIKYQVNIHIPSVLNLTNVHLYVLVTDENNRPVVMPQLFTYDHMSYVFGENGPVTGIRIAWIIQARSDANRIPLDNNSEVMKGTFLPYQIYTFDLYPGDGSEN